MKPIFFTHDDCDAHRMHPGHPERPERRQAILRHLRERKTLDAWEVREPPLVSREALDHVHDAKYLDRIFASSPDEGLADLDPDTAMSPGTLRAARLASGALEEAVALVSRGETRRVFCAMRPPGHHAESDGAMGFCFFNHVAVGAAAALEMPDIERVAVFDFDVHHGNGTVEMFQDRPEVLVCSSFQHPFYPGRYHDVKRPNIVNTPLPAGTGSKEFRVAIERDWTPALEKHRPQIIFVSAGFDAHKDDPLGGLKLDEDDFAWVTKWLVKAAEEHASGRIISTLEGGYDLDALARSVDAHLRELAR
ncbi:histone-like deacetylase family protein [Haloferula helveola]|uniref:Histone-like deacetylase family protein n=1 Tax=Haloferula helveola TaxID=490095 RepID=A0ABM7R7N8_9BACT|nr:histone-like deacetylase family protein [Haloferula helveola]